MTALIQLRDTAAADGRITNNTMPSPVRPKMGVLANRLRIFTLLKQYTADTAERHCSCRYEADDTNNAMTIMLNYNFFLITLNINLFTKYSKQLLYAL